MLIIVQSVQDLSLMTMLIKIDILIIVHIIATSILSTHKIPLLTWYFTMSQNLVFWDRRHVGNLRTQKYHARNGKWYFTICCLVFYHDSLPIVYPCFEDGQHTATVFKRPMPALL